MKTKKLLVFAAVMIMLIAALCVSAFAAEVVDSGKCGENLTWTLDSDGVLTISGEGEMDWFVYIPWHNYKDSINKVVMLNGVSSIRDDAFSGCKSLVSVIIPDSVTGIGSHAFASCESLEKILIPDSVKWIWYHAFLGCTSLKSVTIPSSVTEIFHAFNRCSSLEEINVDDNNPNYSSDEHGVLFDKEKTMLIQAPGAIIDYDIPDGVMIIGEEAFMYCEKLINVDIPDSVTNIFSHAFWNCSSLKNIVLPSQMISIEDYTFADCTSLQNVEISDSVKVICGHAFYNCTSLTKISIPSSVSTFEGSDKSSTGGYCFGYCTSLKEIIIGNGMEKIGSHTFAGCTALTDVYYIGSEEQWNSIIIDNYENDNDPILNATIHYNYAPAHPAGDINGDGKVENSDLVTIARYIVGLTDGDIKTAVEAYADMNNDGKVDNLDIVTVARKIVGLE